MILRDLIGMQAHADDTPIDGRQVKMHGLPITIEHPRGTTRKLHDDSGKVVYRVHMHHAYGFFNGTKGRDGDEVDCFTGPVKDAKEVYVVHMKDMGPVPAEREDEDKCMIGFQSADAAKAAFLMHYPENFYGGMTSLPVDVFKEKMAEASKPHRKKKITASSIGIVGDPGVEQHLRAMPKIPPDFIKKNSPLPNQQRKESADRLPSNQLRSARSTLQKLVMGQAAKQSRCPKCKGRKIVLMPTDYETAKCRDCGHSFQIKACQNCRRRKRSKRLKADFPNQQTALPPVG